MNYALWIVQGLLAAFVAYGRRRRIADPQGPVTLSPGTGGRSDPVRREEACAKTGTKLRKE